MAVPAPAPAHPAHSNRMKLVLCTVSDSIITDPNPYGSVPDLNLYYLEYDPASTDIKISILYPPELQPSGMFFVVAYVRVNFWRTATHLPSRGGEGG